jgi:hypothetical protein
MVVSTAGQTGSTRGRSKNDIREELRKDGFDTEQIKQIVANPQLLEAVLEESEPFARHACLLVWQAMQVQTDTAEALEYNGRYIKAVLRNACEQIVSCRKDQNDTLNAIGYSVGRVLAGAMQQGVKISEAHLSDAQQKLHDAAMKMVNIDPANSWQDHNGAAARTTINSGFSSGLRKPKDLSHVGQKTAENSSADDIGEKEKQSLANAIVTLATAECELFHDASGTTYATFEANGHREVWPVQSVGYREWLGARIYTQRKTAVPEATMANALATISAMAKYEGECREVFRRRAFHQGSYWVDLCNSDWQAVRINEDGWEVVDSPDVMFTRTPTMRALPVPDPEAEIEEIAALWSTANFAQEDQDLVLNFMLESYRPDTPDVGIGLIGEQGSAKSENQRQLRDLIDPNEVPLRGTPKTVEDIYVAASNSMVLSYENISKVDAAQQDALCSILTGGGYASRTLYSNGEETVLKTQAPVMLNGIVDVVTAPDFT